MTHITASYIEKLVRRLMVKNGLGNWSFSWEDTKSALGRCDRVKRTISVSRFLFDNTVDEDKIDFVDTIKHEIAHALAWKHNRCWTHGKVWKQWALRVGAVPKASSNIKYMDINKGVKYVIIDTTNNDNIIRRYYKKPNKTTIAHIHDNAGIRGKPHTNGKLEVREMVNGKVSHQIPTPAIWY